MKTKAIRLLSRITSTGGLFPPVLHDEQSMDLIDLSRYKQPQNETDKLINRIRCNINPKFHSVVSCCNVVDLEGIGKERQELSRLGLI